MHCNQTAANINSFFELLEVEGGIEGVLGGVEGVLRGVLRGTASLKNCQLEYLLLAIPSLKQIIHEN